MTKIQFRVLYRQFLFRMVDLELLSVSAQGDVNKLLGQFAALLVFLSTFLAMTAGMPGWTVDRFLISTTMLAVGLFAILSWDSAFPDKRDVLVLAPLPVRARTLLLAKMTASGVALSITVIALNALPGFLRPYAFYRAKGGIFAMLLSAVPLRTFAAYWITMFAAGAFLFCSVLTVQGLAQLLPRQIFLRWSSFFQMAAFCLFLSVYLLDSPIPTPAALHWLPSYWFLGLFHQLNGTMQPVLIPLARRAWMGLGLSISGAALGYLICYLRTLPKIVEEPDIIARARGINWLPRFGNSLDTAVVQFSIRTLMRSRQHRVMLAFFLGVGLALTVLLLKTPQAEEMSLTGIDAHLLFSSLAMMCVCVVGMRVVFSMPMDLRANWVFRVTEVRGSSAYMAAVRRSPFVLAVMPVMTIAAGLLLWIWPWKRTLEHLTILLLWGSILAYACMYGFEKIPFTCSYRPGKSRVHMVFLAALGMLYLIGEGVGYESEALINARILTLMLGVMIGAVVFIRWRTIARANLNDAVVQFEDLEPPAIQTLGLSA